MRSSGPACAPTVTGNRPGKRWNRAVTVYCFRWKFWPFHCHSQETNDFSALNAREAAAAQFVTELIQKVSPSDAALEEMRAHFSINAVFGIILLIGAYMTMARIIATAGIEVEEAE